MDTAIRVTLCAWPKMFMISFFVKAIQNMHFYSKSRIHYVLCILDLLSMETCKADALSNAVRNHFEHFKTPLNIRFWHWIPITEYLILKQLTNALHSRQADTVAYQTIINICLSTWNIYVYDFMHRHRTQIFHTNLSAAIWKHRRVQWGGAHD